MLRLTKISLKRPCRRQQDIVAGIQLVKTDVTGCLPVKTIYRTLPGLNAPYLGGWGEKGFFGGRRKILSCPSPSECQTIPSVLEDMISSGKILFPSNVSQLTVPTPMFGCRPIRNKTPKKHCMRANDIL